MQSMSQKFRSQGVKWAVFGGLTAGAIDILYAFAANSAKGVAPATVLQAVAAGILGRSAYHGGAGTALIGGVTHFVITVLMALLFLVAATQFGWVRRRMIAAGILYGATVYFGMRWLIVPLSRFPGDLRRFDPIDLAVHVIGVGLVIALFIQRSQIASSREPSSPLQC